MNPDVASSKFRLEDSEIGPIVHYAGGLTFEQFLDGVEQAIPAGEVLAVPSHSDVKQLPSQQVPPRALKGLSAGVHLARVEADDLVIVWERVEDGTTEVAVRADTLERAAALMIYFAPDAAQL